MDEELKICRKNLRNVYKEWNSLMKAGLSNISGAHPTKEQIDRAKERLTEEKAFLESIDQAVNDLFEEIKNTIKEVS